MQIDPEQFYRTDNPLMTHLIGSQSTLANWRCKGIGPAWTKSGKGCLYRGADLLEWLSSRRVEAA